MKGMNAARFEEDVKKSRCLFEHLTLPHCLNLSTGWFQEIILARFTIELKLNQTQNVCSCYVFVTMALNSRDHN